MKLSTGYEERRPRIEIVPLLDVVFLLLVFFIYAMLSMTVYRGLRVDLPTGSGDMEESSPITLTIAEDNSLWLDGQAMGLAEAVRDVARQASGSDIPVRVSGDRRADLGIAVELLSELRKANVTAVSFQVEER